MQITHPRLAGVPFHFWFRLFTLRYVTYTRTLVGTSVYLPYAYPLVLRKLPCADKMGTIYRRSVGIRDSAYLRGRGL